MCKPFSCLVLKSGEVKWKFGVDSHDELMRKFGIREIGVDASETKLARVEIYPQNGKYTNPDRWVFHIDESITPTWWTPEDEKAARKAHGQWKRKLYSVLVRGPIVSPFTISPPRKITKKHIGELKKWASVCGSVPEGVWCSVMCSGQRVLGGHLLGSLSNSVWDARWSGLWDSVRDSYWAYVGSFVRLPRASWVWADSVPGDGYPYQPAINLLEQGLVPAFYGGIWKLYGGNNVGLLWEGKL